MSQKRVLFLVNTLTSGGTERNVSMFCRNIDRTKFLPEVWILRGGGELEQEVKASGIVVKNLDRQSARSPIFACKTARQIAKADFDVVHAFLPAIGVYAALARMIFRMSRPLVYSMGASGIEVPNHFEEWLFKKFFSRRFDRSIVNSKSVAQYAEGMGFSPSSMTLIPNGHDFNRFTTPLDRNAIRASLGVESSQKLICCVGRFIDSKRLCDLVDAMKALVPNHSNLRAILIGDGPTKNEITEQIKKLNLEQHISLLGHRRDVPDLMRASDMFVFPSETEGLPNSIIEAGLAKLPIVTCVAPGIVDVVENEKTALMVPTRDPNALAAAMKRLLDDATLSKNLAENAHRHMLETYSIPQCLEKLYAVYDEVLSKGH